MTNRAHLLTEITRDIVDCQRVSPQHVSRLNHIGFSQFTQLGTDRHVYTDNEVVIKIAPNWDIAKKNEHESLTWDTATKTGCTKLLCPVTDTGPHYRWIEMPLCDHTVTPEQVNEFKTRVKQSDWVLSDIHVDNIGVYHTDTDARIVCYDYTDARYTGDRPQSPNTTTRNAVTNNGDSQ